MTRQHQTGWSRLGAWVVAALVMTACAGGGSGGGRDGGATGTTTPAAPAVVLTDMQPLLDGFAFANFPAYWYPEEFVTEDVVAMFGSDASVCVDGVADPCELTAEAAAFARMVNQSRAAGHCEGLVAVAQARFNEGSDPPTAELGEDPETIKTILRAFATQFIPEVRTEIRTWLETSLAEKIEALQTSLAEGKLRYSLGVYVEDGGHAVLPYAVEYLTPTRPRIMIYDSNWPGRNRWVDVDLETETWSFSFWAEDPDDDPDLWTGAANRMDLTAIESRAGSCPFCSTEVGVSKNVLLVRSTDLNWSVEADGTTVDPQNPGEEDSGFVATPVKGQGAGERPSYDYFIELPVSADGERAKLNLPGTTSVFALTPSGIAQISTPGNADVPVEVGATSFVSADPAVTLSLASGNLVATASGPSASLEIAEEGLKAAVTTEDGRVVELAVTPETPAAKIVADPARGGIEVLAQAADGIVEKREIAADGTETVTIDTTPLDLNATTWEAPPGLESVAIPGLPSPDERNFNNPDYAVDEPYTPPDGAVSVADTVPVATTTVPPVTTTVPPVTTTVPPVTTTVPSSTTTTTTTTTTVPTTTTTTVPTTTTTTVPPTTPPVTPNLSLSALPSATVGDAAIPLFVLSNSPAAITYASSNVSVATITPSGPSGAEITIVGAGTTTITASQPAVSGFTAISVSRTLTVSKRIQSPLGVVAVTGSAGSAVSLTTTGGSGVGGVTFALTVGNDASCGLVGDQLVRSSGGTCEVVATKATDDVYLAVSSVPETITFSWLPQSPLALVSVTGSAGSAVTLTTTGGSGVGGVTFALTVGNDASCGLVGDQLVRSSAGTCEVVATKATDDVYLAISSEPLTIAFEPVTRVLLYQVDNPSRQSGLIQYHHGLGTGTEDAAARFDAQGRTLERIVYRMELTVGGVPRYAEVSFDAWEGITATGLRIPDGSSGNDFVLRRFVEKMTVESNMTADAHPDSSGVTEGSGRRGYLEIWPSNYTESAHPDGPPPSAISSFDFNDTFSGDGTAAGHGSFQVHDVTVPGTGSTIMAWNAHHVASPEIGLGSQRNGHPDWTFSGLGQDGWRLQIFAAPRTMIATGGTVEDVNVDGVVYRTHTFTTVGAQTFTVTDAGSSGTVEYLVVGGGGGGGRSGPAGAGGGGGGGAVVTGTRTLTAGTYEVTVGAGGPGNKSDTHVTGVMGEDSSFDGVLALGGGGGGGGNSAIPGSAPSSRATGGGAGATSAEAMTGAAGTEGAGFGGGDSQQGFGGGGGGARGAGSAAAGGGSGGLGQSVTISGSSVSYGGGGGGGCQTASCVAGIGIDGGGSGGAMSSTGLPGTTGTGGGGGGAGGHVVGGGGGDGGSGIVIIRYRLSL